ncbi:MAG: nicotinate phosphoribosyltransferase, partial [Deltaproteobacteria bacterium]|nr:nicotinate phosphoribosyltransferase [Deltaproteobacteria bacterium]
MNFTPVINSLLDTDLYKFTMLQAFLHQFPGAEGEYRFKCRNKPAIPLSTFKKQIEAQIDHLCTLRLRQEELDYMRNLRFIKNDLVDYLDLFQFRRRFIEVEVSKSDPDKIEIVARGPLMHVMLFEIFVLAIVSEVYFNQFDQEKCFEEGRRRLSEKIRLLKEFGGKPPLRHPYIFFDFGTRRRACRK